MIYSPGQIVKVKKSDQFYKCQGLISKIQEMVFSFGNDFRAMVLPFRKVVTIPAILLIKNWKVRRSVSIDMNNGDRCWNNLS